MTQWGLDNLFNPGKRHMDDEKRRLQSTREEVGDNSGGRRIDLEGGKVSISVPRRAVESDSATVSDAEAFEPALDAEDVPAIALASDEAEIAPGVEGAEVDASAAVGSDAPETADVVEPEPAPTTAGSEQVGAEPDAAPAPRRRLSANAWSRRG